MCTSILIMITRDNIYFTFLTAYSLTQFYYEFLSLFILLFFATESDIATNKDMIERNILLLTITLQVVNHTITDVFIGIITFQFILPMNIRYL